MFPGQEEILTVGMGHTASTTIEIEDKLKSAAA
jgi:hypothetical protein